MKKRRFIFKDSGLRAALMLSVLLCATMVSAQKPDSIGYRQLFISNKGTNYSYALWKAKYDGTRTLIENKECDNDLFPFGKLGADGWLLITSYKQDAFIVYIFSKTYRRK